MAAEASCPWLGTAARPAHPALLLHQLSHPCCCSEDAPAWERGRNHCRVPVLLHPQLGLASQQPGNVHLQVTPGTWWHCHCPPLQAGSSVLPCGCHLGGTGGGQGGCAPSPAWLKGVCRVSFSPWLWQGVSCQLLSHAVALEMVAFFLAQCIPELQCSPVPRCCGCSHLTQGPAWPLVTPTL